MTSAAVLIPKALDVNRASPQLGCRVAGNARSSNNGLHSQEARSLYGC